MPEGGSDWRSIWALSCYLQRSFKARDCADAVTAGALSLEAARSALDDLGAAQVVRWPAQVPADVIGEATDDALWWLLGERLYRPQSKVRFACRTMIAEGLHLRDYHAVERAAQRAAPTLPDHIRQEVLAELVAALRRRSAGVARARR